jgi:hypothetical protein
MGPQAELEGLLAEQGIGGVVFPQQAPGGPDAHRLGYLCGGQG